MHRQCNKFLAISYYVNHKDTNIVNIINVIIYILLLIDSQQLVFIFLAIILYAHFVVESSKLTSNFIGTNGP